MSSKITDLTADTAPTKDDVTVTVDIGTGANRKVTLENAITKAHGLADGLVKVATGAMAVGIAGTDYSAGTAALGTGIVKSTTTTGALTIAIAGTDYVAAETDPIVGAITGIVKADGGGAISAATAGTDYSAGTAALATGIVKSTTGTGALTIATAGTDYIAGGTGNANQLAYFSAAGAITGDANLSWDTSQLTIGVPAAGKVYVNARTAVHTGIEGALGIVTTSLTNNIRSLDIDTVLTNTTGINSYGVLNTISHNEIVTGTNHTTTGIYTNISKTGADTSADTYTTYGHYVAASNVGSTDAGTKITYAGLFSASGDTAGTSTAYGIYAQATGADTNYAAFFNGGDVRIDHGVLSVSNTGSLILGTSTGANGQVIFHNSTNANTVTIQPGASAASHTYTLPLNVGAAGQVLTDAAGNGVLSWAAAGGGGSLDDAYNGGSTITADAGAVAITGTAETLDIDSTATTQTVVDITASSLTTGSALRVYSNSASTSARNLVDIISDNSAASSGSTIALNIQQDGTPRGQAMLITSASTTEFGVVKIVSRTTTGTTLYITDFGLTTGKSLRIEGGTLMSTGRIASFEHIQSASALVNKTADMNAFISSRTNTKTSGTLADDFDLVSISRTSVMNGAGGTFTPTGSVLKLSNTSTQTAGTLTDTTLALEIDHNTYTAAATYAVSITHNNGGGGTPGGIDLSTFSAAEPLLNVPVDTGGVGAAYGRIAVNVVGVGIKYILLSEAA